MKPTIYYIYLLEVWRICGPVQGTGQTQVKLWLLICGNCVRSNWHNDMKIWWKLMLQLRHTVGLIVKVFNSDTINSFQLFSLHPTPNLTPAGFVNWTIILFPHLIHPHTHPYSFSLTVKARTHTPGYFAIQTWTSLIQTRTYLKVNPQNVDLVLYLLWGTYAHMLLYAIWVLSVGLLRPWTSTVGSVWFFTTQVWTQP